MTMSFRTNDRIEEALAFLTDGGRISRQVVIEKAIVDQAERAGHRIRAIFAAEEMWEEWKETLRQLGTA